MPYASDMEIKGITVILRKVGTRTLLISACRCRTIGGGAYLGERRTGFGAG